MLAHFLADGFGNVEVVGQYMKASELIPSSGTRILCLESSPGGEMAISHGSCGAEGMTDYGDFGQMDANFPEGPVDTFRGFGNRSHVGRDHMDSKVVAHSLRPHVLGSRW